MNGSAGGKVCVADIAGLGRPACADRGAGIWGHRGSSGRRPSSWLKGSIMTTTMKLFQTRLCRIQGHCSGGCGGTRRT